MFKLVVDAGPGWPLGLRPLLLGRGQGNDVQLSDDAVSSRHAAVWTDGETVWVQDLRSRNGVFVNGTPVSGIARAGLGDVVTIGCTNLTVARGPARETEVTTLVVEHLATGLRTAFVGTRLRLGDSADADLALAGVKDTVLLRVTPEDVLLGRDDDTTPLRLGQPFDLGPHRLVLLAAPTDGRRTRDLAAPPRPALRATLTGGPGPRAWISDAGGRTLEIPAANRATLLWLLARRIAEDRATGLPDARAGWLSEQDVVTAVWGRGGGTPANLRVLLCRIRAELREAGLDPWMIEHRAGYLRANTDAVTIE